MGAICVREARSSDAATLGAVHVTSWRETYAGLLPDQLLEELSVDAQSAMWGNALNDPAALGGTAILVAESGGELVGFGACGSQRDDALKRQGFDGEVGAIYILRSHQRAGVGRSLMGLMSRKLHDQGRKGAALWVLRDNVPARRFYERLGGTLVAERMDENAGVVLAEVAYGWSDLSLWSANGSRT